MDEESCTTEAELIFEGPADPSPETLARIKGVFIADFNLEIPDVQRILGEAPARVKTFSSVEAAERAKKNLQRAGARVLVVSQAPLAPDSEGDGVYTLSTESDQSSLEDLLASVGGDDGSTNESTPPSPSAAEEPTPAPPVDTGLSLSLSLGEELETSPPPPPPTPQPEPTPVSLLSFEDGATTEAQPPVPPPQPEAPKAPATSFSFEELAEAPPLTKPAEVIPTKAYPKSDEALDLLLSVEELKAPQQTDTPPPEAVGKVARTPSADPVIPPLPEEMPAPPPVAEEPTPRLGALHKGGALSPTGDVAASQPEVAPTATKRAVPWDLIGGAILGAIVLLVGNYFLFASGSDTQATTTRSSKRERAVVKEEPATTTAEASAPASATDPAPPLPSPAPGGTDRFEFSERVTSPQLEMEVRLTGVRGGVEGGEIIIEQTRPPDPSDLGLVRGELRAPWAYRVEVERLKFEKDPSGSLVSKAQAKVFIDYKGERVRRIAHALVRVTFPVRPDIAFVYLELRDGKPIVEFSAPRSTPHIEITTSPAGVGSFSIVSMGTVPGKVAAKP